MEAAEGDSQELTNEELFDNFLYADLSVAETLAEFEKVKNALQLQDTPHHQFFSRLKENFQSWRVTSFLEILQRRLNVKEYASSVNSCKDCNIFVIGAGPCGLRYAIEAALCGAYVVVAEKRGSFTRNNVLHLWPYLIHDLRNLGTKKLFGKFCAGSLDHISIKRLQHILLKIALVLGVKVYANTSFVEYLEPCNSTGWRISVKPSILEIELRDFHVLVGADGKRNSIPGFQRKEFRAKLAIGITANFVNKNTDEEAKIEEISGVAALFNQKFFADLKTETDIDLENIVYYKDDTHYFVMTAKKMCLLKKGVLKEDNSDVMKLLSYRNVDKGQLLNFVHQAAEFSAGLPHNEIAINPDNGQEDVAIFDFTSMYSAEYAAKILERRGKRFVIGLVGDGLMEPFWPLGTGCARGFLSCMDLMWMIKQHQQGSYPGDLLAERMALYQLLHQTSNENMHKKHSAYTMDPKTRYKIIPKFSEDVSYLYSNEEKENKHRVQETSKEEEEKKMSPGKRKLAGETTETVHKQWKKSTFARTRKPRTPSIEALKRTTSPSEKRKSTDDQETVLAWCQERLKPILPYLPITDLDTCWRDGVLLCGLVHLCSPKDIDLNAVKQNTDAANVDLAITVMFNEFGIQTLTSDDVLPPSGPDLLAIITTIVELKRVFEEGAVRVAPSKRPAPDIRTSPPSVQDSSTVNTPKKSKVLKSESVVTTPAPSTPAADTPATLQQQVTPMDVDQAPVGSLKKRVHSQRKLRKKTESKFIAQVDNVAAITSETKVSTPNKGSQKCHTCELPVLVIRRVTVEGYVFHRKCFICEECQTTLKMSTYHLITSNDPSLPGRFYCKKHFTEIMSRSRELSHDKTRDKSRDKKKGKKDKRPQSACLDKSFNKKVRSPFRSKTPVVMEEEETHPSETVPPSETSPPSETVPSSKGTPPPKGTPPLKAVLNNPDMRYRDTSLEIHKTSSKSDAIPSKPRRTTGTVTITESGASKKTVVQSRSPSPPPLSFEVKNKRCPEKSPAVAKKLAFSDDLPTEELPDNSFLPTEHIPRDHSNVTTRKKSKKSYKAPAPPTKTDVSSTSESTDTPVSEKPGSEKRSRLFKKQDKSPKTFIAGGPGTGGMVVSPPTKRRLPTQPVQQPIKPTKPALEEPAVKEPAAQEPDPRSIAQGVRKGREINASRITDPSASVSRPPVTRPPITAKHTRSGSLTDLDTYLPKKTQEMSSKYSKRSGKEEDGPVSVKDRIAQYHQNDVATSASFSAGERKRVVVSPKLKDAVNRDSDRISAKRSAMETDSSPATTSNFVRTTRKRKLRLKPSNKHNQRRLAQAQTIQRDRSLLEQKMTEFENHAAHIEQQLRSNGNDDKDLLSQFLELVNIKNELTRRENELHLCEKYLQLLDEQDQIERDLRYLLETDEADKTVEHKQEEEDMIVKKFDVVNRRDYLLMQLDESKRREEEENAQINAMLSAKGMSSKQFSYDTNCFLTIESLLEDESDEDVPNDEEEDALAIFEQSTAQVMRRDKKKRDDENPISRFFQRISIF